MGSRGVFCALVGKGASLLASYMGNGKFFEMTQYMSKASSYRFFQASVEDSTEGKTQRGCSRRDFFPKLDHDIRGPKNLYYEQERVNCHFLSQKLLSQTPSFSSLGMQICIVLYTSLKFELQNG